jgi:N-acetylglucosaminyldiphosphoundecaprenol N-acetyl-beta-D-mannosaminyltransferase
MLHAAPSRKLAVLLGIPVDNLDMNETLDLIDNFVVSGRKDHRGHQVATANVDFLVKAQYDSELRAILRRADLITADGMPLVWGSRLLGVPSKGRVAGSDLVPILAGRAAKKGYSIFLLGAAPEVARKAAAILIANNPGLNIVGVVSPPIMPIDRMDPAILEQIKSARPDILLVAFGNPKQEKWIARYGKSLGIPVMMGIGGTLDFITGNTRRAPKWMHGMGLEWIHRMLSEPRRLLKRYLVDLVVFNGLFIWQFIALKTSCRRATYETSVDYQSMDQHVMIHISGKFTSIQEQPFWQVAEKALEVSSNLIINLEKVSCVDIKALGSLIDLFNLVNRFGGTFTLAAVPNHIKKLLAVLKLNEFFIVSETSVDGIIEANKTAGS